MNRKQLTALLVTTLFSLTVLGGQTRVAVAANFTAPMMAITSLFEQSSGHQVSLAFGSSGQLFAQIQNGAPFDVFLSADTVKPIKLIHTGRAVPGSCFTYAVGRLALWSGRNRNAKALLENNHYNRLAMANPRLAPYGEAARQTLKALGLQNAARIVTGENIAQTYQFVATGNADIGFVALSQILNHGRLPDGAWVVPTRLYTPIQQNAVLLVHGASNEAAKALIEFLHSESALKIIRRYGYDVSNK